MDLRVIAVVVVALVGLWCVVVLPALVVSGRLSELERSAEIETALWRSVRPDGDEHEGDNDDDDEG